MQVQKWALGPCVHAIFVSSVQSTALFLLLSSYFKVASDRAKWSNYVHSHISGTQSVNTTPFCAVTQALVPKHQVWTAPYQTIHMLNPLTERRYNNDEEEEDQNNTWFSVIYFPVWGTSNSEGKKELKQARLINKKACLQGSKKPEFKLVLWGSSCHILLARGHFLLISVDGLCPLDKKALKVICPVRKCTRSRLPNGTFLESCYTTVHSVHPWTVNC